MGSKRVTVLSNEFSPGTKGTKQPVCYYGIAGCVHFRGYNVWLLMGMQSAPKQNVH